MKYLTMTSQEINRHTIIEKLINKEINGTQAAELLKLTIRHIKRLKAGVKKNGPKALVHGKRGKPGNRGMPEEEEKKIIELLHEHYHDFGPTFAAEKLT